MSVIRALSGAKRISASDCRTIAIYEYTPYSKECVTKHARGKTSREHRPGDHLSNNSMSFSPSLCKAW